MLRQLLTRLQPKTKRVLGFRLARELGECGTDIMAVFGVTDFHRDYEDTWEWLDGNSSDGMHVNVSRPHNWETGDYDTPVILRVEGPTVRLTDELFFRYAQRLATTLQTEVWDGHKVARGTRERDYDFEIEHRFTPAA